MNQSSLDSYQVLARAFKLYKDTFWPAILFSILGSSCWFEPQFFFKLNTVPSVYSLAWFIPAWIGAFIFWMAVIIYQYGSMHIFNYTLGQSLLFSLKRIVPALIVTSIYILIIASSSLLLIFPGFILSITLMFGFFLVTTHKASIMNALLYSHKLVWGEFWYTTTIISVPTLIYGCATLVSYLLVIRFCSAMEHFNDYATLAQAIIQIITVPYLFAVALCLMQNLEIRYNAKNL